MHDRVLCIPEHYDDWKSYTFPGWDHETVFNNANPVYVEYCAGNGTWILEKARAHPDINWVAVEKRYDRVAKIWSKIKNWDLPNLICVWGEAHITTEQYFPSDSVTQMYINFPDPWPKKKHHKHRLMKQAFVEQMVRVLKPEGSLTLVTDDVEYSELAIVELTGNPALTSKHPDPYFIEELPGYGTSFFDSLWRERGRKIHYHQFDKKR
jgi:tRNA (guanine-N7-)-methyltransferase